MSDLRCLNCDTHFEPSDRFCSRCGQRTDAARLSLYDIARDLLQRFANVERSPPAFAWSLLTRPGLTAREYVDGKRRRHYGPFATLTVLVGVTALAVNTLGFQILAGELVPGRPANLMQSHFDLVLLVQLPLLGAACALMFRGDRLRFAEHLVLVAYTLSVRAALLAVVLPITYFTYATAASTGSTVAFWSFWYVYFGWAASQFYGGARWSSWLRGAIAAAIGHAGITALMLVGSRMYVALWGG